MATPQFTIPKTTTQKEPGFFQKGLLGKAIGLTKTVAQKAAPYVVSQATTGNPFALKNAQKINNQVGVIADKLKKPSNLAPVTPPVPMQSSTVGMFAPKPSAPPSGINPFQPTALQQMGQTGPRLATPPAPQVGAPKPVVAQPPVAAPQVTAPVVPPAPVVPQTQAPAAPQPQAPAAPVPTAPTAPAPAAPAAPAPTAPAAPAEPKAPSQLEALQKMITDFKTPTESESALQQQIDAIAAQEANLNASLRQGLASAEGRAVPLTFIAGEQAQLQRQATAQGETLAAQKVPLQQQLARLQANRAAQLTAATKAAELAKPAEGFTLGAGQARYDAAGNLIAQQKEDKTTTLNPGQILVDASGNVVYTAPNGAEKPITVSEGSVLVDSEGNVLYSNPKQASENSVAAKSLTGAQLSDALSKGYDTEDKLAQYSQLVGSGQVPPVLKVKSAEMVKLEANVLSGLDSLATIRESLGGLPGQPSMLFSRTTRAAHANLADIIGRIRSGGAITEDELNTFRKLLPKVTDSDATAAFKLDQIENLLRSVVKDTNATPSGDPLDAALDAAGFKNEQQTSLKGNIQIPSSSRLAFVNNNPGNLRFAGQAGATQGEGGFARFNTPAAGYQALKNQILLDANRGLNLRRFIFKFAPPTENNSELYLQQIKQATGANDNTLVAKIDIDALAKAMAKKESSTIIT